MKLEASSTEFKSECEKETTLRH